MAKLDYKKLWEQQKKDNILLRTENERLEREAEKSYLKAEEFEGLFRKWVENAESWQQMYNEKKGESEGIMRCFKELLNNKNKQK